MFKRVLVPMNGSRSTERILPHLVQLTKWCDSELTLLHVLRPTRSRTVGEAQIEYPNVLTDRAQGLAREYFTELIGHLEEEGVSARPTTATGELVDTVVSRASSGGFDLLALAVGEPHPVIRHLTESPSEKIRVRSPIPMLVLNGKNAKKVEPEAAPISGLLVALNGTRVSEFALPYARRLSRAANLPITLLRVVPEIPGFHMASQLTTTSRRFLQDACEKAEAYLEQQACQLAEEGFDVDTRIEIGPAARTMVDIQDAHPEYLLVVGSVVRGGWRRAMLGCTADEVIRESGRPLLLIPAGRRSESADDGDGAEPGSAPEANGSTTA